MFSGVFSDDFYDHRRRCRCLWDAGPLTWVFFLVVRFYYRRALPVDRKTGTRA